jgi:peptide/nickel transport system permease protein
MAQVTAARPLPAQAPPKRSFALPRGLPIFPVAILVGFVLMALLAPVLAPHSPTAVNLTDSFRPPFWQEGGKLTYPLGTDKIGRDILSRILYGSQISLLVIFVSIILSGIIGIAAGMLAGYYGRWVETVIMRLVDVKLSLPTILLALLFSVVWGPSLNNLLAVIIITLWALYARQVHAETLSLKTRDYVLAARALGASDLRLLAVHMLPNLMNSMIVLATLQIATIVLMEAALSFLGVGIPPPTPAWGLMIAEGREVLEKAWWVAAMPGIALSLVILSANMAGDWLRDYLDPVLRHSRT